MGCSTCKKKKININTPKTVIGSDNTTLKNIKDYIIKSLIFLFMLIILTPFIIPIFIIVLFQVVILSKGVNLLPLVFYIGNRIFKGKDYTDEDDDEDDDEDEEYELVNQDEIIEIK